MLAVIETHPVQYHAPVYRMLQKQFGVPVTVIYGSDFSIAGYRDREFGASFSWDTNLLSGYTPRFLSRVENNGAGSFEQVTARGLREALREIAPKATLILGYSPRFNQLAFYEARKFGAPILFRGETTDHARRRNSVKARLRDTLLRWGYRRFDRLLYIGKRSHEHYKRLGCPDEKLVFSPYCVDVSSFNVDEESRHYLRSAMRRSLGVEASQLILLFSGKLSSWKGPDLILKAIKQLPAELRRRIVALFLGSGQLMEELKHFAQDSPQVKALFPGFQNQTQLSRYYHAADLLVLPSQGETWGLVVNEAMHHGLPCVVSEKVGCAPDLIEAGDTGYTCVTGSFQNLAQTLRQAVALIDREDIRQNCRRKVSGYTVENAARGIAEAYRQVNGQ